MQPFRGDVTVAVLEEQSGQGETLPGGPEVGAAEQIEGTAEGAGVLHHSPYGDHCQRRQSYQNIVD